MVARGRRCERLLLRFMIFMNSASTQDEGTGRDGQGENGVG
jgi:hypothetical protein